MSTSANGRPAAAPVAPPAAPAPPERKILVVDKPGSPQTALLAFGVGMPRNSADYPAATVMNTMLGGLFSSRINMNLREEHGYTYGARRFLLVYRGTGPFITYALVRTDVTAPATEQMFKELDGIHTKPLTDAELRMAKNSIIRSLPGSFESAASVNGQLADLWLFGLPLDYYTKLPAQIEGVTSADAQAAAEKYIHPDKMLVIEVGDKSKIEQSLKDLKLGPVEEWSEKGSAPGGKLTDRPGQSIKSTEIGSICNVNLYARMHCGKTGGGGRGACFRASLFHWQWG